ncbi:hypothetical protein niasHT_033382 [Heterodera trifolii]|uniref:RING-type domain-containing protein n=1 Tax=Heterodera trifolii TaxID=157864 RepID=A0ABD2HXY6_9BILA
MCLNILIMETHQCLLPLANSLMLMSNLRKVALEPKPFARGWLGLKCVAENCENPIPWQELKAVLPGKLESIQALENQCAELCASAAKEFGFEELEHSDENEKAKVPDDCLECPICYEFVKNDQLCFCDHLMGDEIFGSSSNNAQKESHAFCRECLQNYTEVALESKSFARGWLGLKCVAENCENPIPWQELKAVLPGKLESIQALENQCAELCASAAKEFGLEELEHFDENESHAFCRECLKGYTKAALETKPFARGWLGLKCMAVKCQNPIPWHEIKKDASPDELEIIEILENQCAELSVSAADLYLERCPKCNCAVEMDGPLPPAANHTKIALLKLLKPKQKAIKPNDKLKFHCPECNYEMCRKCNEKWTEEHNNLSCEQLAKQQNRQNFR